CARRPSITTVGGYFDYW
nr:immunoglobulin heavy chain junction region [Mus musculus]MBK4184566.1 immunoglobulin heavy chain junction region [Mus musculus]MBK4184567.1 immunoglobulin heavy chain junction region [Mus musculus]MBK4184569.1 immunoglobulin heavy chain junction region [Mus musculus]